MNRTNFRRYINRNNRILLAYERKNSRLIRRALLEQVKAYVLTGGLPDTLTPVLAEMYMDVGERFYSSQRKLFGDMAEKSIFLDIFRMWFAAYANTVLASKVTRINETTLDRLQVALQELIPESLTYEQMVERLSKDFAFSPRRSMMIARTEVGNAMNMAKERSKDDMGLEDGEAMYKIWVHRGSLNPRDWHQELDDGQAIPADEDFIVVDPDGNVERMSRPHDEGASAANVINCGCEVIYMTEGFAKRNGYL